MKMLMTSLALLTLTSVRADSDTLAFYPFCDKAAHESAVGTVTNAVLSGSLDGIVTAMGSAPEVVFASEAPGRYLYASGRTNAALLVSGLQSVDLGQGEASVSSALLSVPGAAQTLSECHEIGYTIEFFFRLPPQAAVPSYSATLLYDCGYEFEGIAYPIKVYLPCSDGLTFRYGLNGYNAGSGSKAGFEGKIVLGSAIDARLTYSLNDGRWHHFAVVEKVSGSTVSLCFYVDRILTKTHNLPATVTCNTLSKADPEFKLACGAVSGNLTGLRLTGRSLEPTEFLVASERSPGSFGADVLAFYPCDDRTSGESAVGRTVFNAAQPMISPCLVQTNSTNSVATFDAEGPAKYIFVGEQYGATPFYTAPGSICLTSSQTGDSGTLSFDRLATELSKCHANGHTVEWFFKLTDDLISPTAASYYCKAGYLYNTIDKQCCLCLPFSMSYDDGRQFRFSLGYYSDGRCLTKTLDYHVTEGNWHHVAVVKRASTLEIYVDYLLYGSVAVDGTQEVTEDRSLGLVRSALHGKFSCVKVTKRALEIDEFLRASNLETYWPKTFTHVTFDGQAGAPFPSIVSNAATSFAAANPHVYAATDCSGDFTVNGAVSGNPAFTSACRYSKTRVTGESAEREDISSVSVASTGLGETGFRPAPNFRMPVSASHALPSDFTMEGFFKFDKASWVEDVGSYAQDRDRLNLFSRKFSSGFLWKLSFVDALSQTAHRLYLYAYDEDGTAREVITSGLYFNDDTWHHIALTYDSANNRLAVYCDYEQVIVTDLDKALKSSTSGYLAVGDGTAVNDNAFHGWVDEVRYSNACLAPVDFLRLERVPQAFIILCR